MNKKGMTLVEILVVIIIIGVLATLGFAQYGGYQEKTLDREAQANLLLILAGERIARMESNDNYYVSPSPNTNAGINTLLRMALPVTEAKWNYTIPKVSVSPAAAAFCAQATRNVTAGRSFYIISPTGATPDPQPTSGACP